MDSRYRLRSSARLTGWCRNRMTRHGPPRTRTATGLAEEVREHGIHLHQLGADSRAAMWYAIEPGYKHASGRRYCGTERCFVMTFRSVLPSAEPSNS